MASLFESLTQSLTPEVMGAIGKATGLDLNQATKGFGVVGPLITSALANRASTPDGLSGLMNALSPSSGEGLLSDISKMISGGGAPASMMSGLFGPGLGAMGGTIDRALGFKVSPLIAMAAPFVLKQLSQRMTAQKLDQNGVAQLLRDEQTAVGSKTDKATATVVQQALEAGNQATRTKARYPADQWNDVRLGAAAVAVHVMGASPSGFAGAAKEVMALGKTLAAAKKDASPTSILSLAFETELRTDDFKKLPQDGAGLVNMARRAMQAVATHSPSDAAAYGRLLVDAATHVAEASKEGGFLGIGGTRVSAQEQQAIDEIRAAVGQVTMV
jgi:hypothetical protein